MTMTKMEKGERKMEPRKPYNTNIKGKRGLHLLLDLLTSIHTKTFIVILP